MPEASLSTPLQQLKPMQRTALQLLLDGHSKAEIREKLGISQPTMYRWMQLPAWHAALEEAVRGDVKSGEVHLKTLIPLASKVLKKLALTGTDQIQLGACRLIYETADRMLTREEQKQVVVELEEQLEDLKSLVAQNQLPQASGEVIEAEITPIAHADAHGDPDPAPEAKEELE